MFRYKKGCYNIIDEVTGKQFLSDELVVDWDGSYRHRRNVDGKHPDFWDQNIPPERFPRLILEPTIDVYVTASVTFHEGTDVPRLRE